jgi:hypothetical protein
MMNPDQIMLAVFGPLPQWANFLAMFGGVLLAGAMGALVWFLFLRKRRKRKHRQHHHEKRQLNPTLAKTGGLPPKRGPDQPPPAS